MALAPTAAAGRLTCGRWLHRPADGVVRVCGCCDVNANYIVRRTNKLAFRHRSDNGTPRSGPIVLRCVLPCAARAAETA
ncbi:hypothetical protein GCM10028784_28750 [Myceligenerans cantabricum]